VRVRFFNTYGPGEFYSPYRSVNCMFCYRALHGIPFTVYRGHRRTSTYVSDAVFALANIQDNSSQVRCITLGAAIFTISRRLRNMFLKQLEQTHLWSHTKKASHLRPKINRLTSESDGGTGFLCHSLPRRRGQTHRRLDAPGIQGRRGDYSKPGCYLRYE